MFRKILVANRGEIACRVMATAKRMGIASVAIYSEADDGARHTRLAEESWPIGPAPSRQSYLDGERILDVARRSGAQAIHPGYGFLSENADFAAACTAAGLVFIGPPADAIRAMGSKAASKALMERSGVPLVPGYHGAAQSPAVLAAAAERIGYPVLIKASAGGGGKGMRIVEHPDHLAEAIEGAKREAAVSFGDDRLLIERYLSRPRHIEIQVFADSFGKIVSLFERDCSIQRRHQKVVEEAPAPGLDPARRVAMGEAAIAAARAVGYVGAGTVEFIAENGAFYFMEMNTRLQVEHPVTEMITGQDLVEWQLRVAAGQPLPASADTLAISGHAIEVRVYAEDPARDFLPSVGPLVHLRQPRDIPGRVRVDTGVRQGDPISSHYDPMIAKLIVWGEDRAAAIRQLQAAISEYEVVGVQTNLALLRAIAGHPAFGAGGVDTGFIARHASELMPNREDGGTADPQTDSIVLAAAAMRVLRDRRTASAAHALAGADPWSPWSAGCSWRMNGDGVEIVHLCRNGGTEPLTLATIPLADGRTRLVLPSGPVDAEWREDDEAPLLLLDGVARRVRVVRADTVLTVIVGGANHVVTLVDPFEPPGNEATGSDRVTAPISGRVCRVLVQPGDSIVRNASLIVLEAMKMELTLKAPRDGTVQSLLCALDDMVEEGTELVTFVIDAEGAEIGARDDP